MVPFMWGCGELSRYAVESKEGEDWIPYGGIIQIDVWHILFWHRGTLRTRLRWSNLVRGRWVRKWSGHAKYTAVRTNSDLNPGHGRLLIKHVPRVTQTLAKMQWAFHMRTYWRISICLSRLLRSSVYSRMISRSLQNCM